MERGRRITIAIEADGESDTTPWVAVAGVDGVYRLGGAFGATGASPAIALANLIDRLEHSYPEFLDNEPRKPAGLAG